MTERRTMGVAQTPPHSDEAEYSVLGALLLDNRAWDRVADILLAEAFYRPENRAIYASLGQLIGAGKVADVVTVFEAGGHDLAYLNELAESVPSAAAARRYAEIVVQRWTERETMRIAADLADDARRGMFEDDALGLRIDKAVTALMQLQRRSTAHEPQRADVLAARFVDHVSAIYEGKEETVKTGLVDLDKLTAEGIRPGELWVIGARPSMGKTALTGTLARNMAARKGALFMSQEDSLMALTARHVAALGRVNLADLRNPRRAPDSMWQGLADGVDQLRVLDLWIDDQSSLTLSDVRGKIQVIKRKTALGVVVIDYLQLMTGQGDNRNIELGKIANGLKAAAKDFGVGVILLSQLNRDVDKRTGPPIMSDLRDSGDIEGAADLIGLLHREYKRNPTEENKHHAELHVVKHKSGATDTVHLWFDGAYQRFTDWSGPPPSRGGRRSAGRGGDEAGLN